MEMVTHTEAGKAIIVLDGIASMGEIGQPRGTIALGILLATDPLNNVEFDKSAWCLFWQWGGDWSVFNDGAEYDADLISGWEPDAIREAIEHIKALGFAESVMDDMEWFSDWADAAESTISQDANAD